VNKNIKLGDQFYKKTRSHYKQLLKSEDDKPDKSLLILKCLGLWLYWGIKTMRYNAFKKTAVGLFTCLAVFWASPVMAQEAGRAPDTAFDSTNGRYLMVWEEDAGSGNVQIMGKFLNPDGTDQGAEIFQLSPDRATQGCFYGQFDQQNGDITTPTNCPQNSNPTVAFNDGQFLIAWEVHGTAGSPSTSPENEFINIFARIVNADDLDPITGWDEGIVISKIFIAANNSDSCGNGKFACNDSEIQAWSQSLKPHVAPRIGTGGFVVTWETNKDFIGCASADRRGGWSVYGRYIDQSFSATSTTNPVMFAVYKDSSTMETSCATLSNVQNGTNSRIAYNATTNDFVIVYELARADGGSPSIGAKRVTLDDDNVGQVGGSMMAGILASADGESFSSPDILSFNNRYVLVTSDGTNLRTKRFASDSISNSDPDALDLGDGNQRNPRAMSNLGAGGQGPLVGIALERMAITYEQGGNIRVVQLDEDQNITRVPQTVSGSSNDNQAVEVASDFTNFVSVWQGEDSGEKVYASAIPTEDDGDTGEPPTAPVLLTPDDGVTFPPIRAYLSWEASTDPEDGEVTYNVYIGENTIPGTPQVTGLTELDFVIGPETEPTTGITLQANTTYQWKIEAQDEDGNLASSMERTLNTDNSLVGWWRFDEDPAGPDCAGGDPGETVCDYSDNNNHGIPAGGPTWVMPGMPDILGGALNLDGMDDIVDIEYVSSFDVGSEMTLSCKLNPSVLISMNDTAIVTRDHFNSAQGPFHLGQNFSEEIAFGIYTLPPAWNFASGDISSLYGTELRLFGIYDGVSTQLFFDNLLQDSVPTLNPPFLNANSIRIGYNEFNDTYLNSTIDECFLINRVLISSERENIVNSE